MTPTKKGKATCIKIERKKKLDLDNDDNGQHYHVAGGEHKGLVINREEQGKDADLGKPQVQLGFNCFLVDQKTGKHAVESRKLKFWYVESADYLDQVTTGFNFFRELLKPENFPKDYVGFIKKCMKLMQKPDYNMAKKIDLEIQQLDDDEAPRTPGFQKEDLRSREEIVREKLLEVLESAYPNVLSVEDLMRICNAEEDVVIDQLRELAGRNLIREMEKGGFVRLVLDEKTEVQEVHDVKQMASVISHQQPTIGIITANYCEKLAVDSMMRDKTTFVKFKTGGESNVYTIGFIGEHKVVSTKLPAIGPGRAAQISSGNTTTRLLGTFQEIEHVFIVGVGGSVPHFTDYYKHTRLGDVIISKVDSSGNIYYYCDKILQDPKDGSIEYHTKKYHPKDLFLQKVVEQIQEMRERRSFNPWEKYILEGLDLLATQEADYNRPPADSDRLTMMIGEGNVIEMQHPERPEGVEERTGMPRVHFGMIGSGKSIVYAEDLRLDFAQRYGINVIDTEFDQVLESIIGSVKESFIFIRGIADYKDGSSKQEWQPYAALCAAAVMKSIIKSFNDPHASEDEIF